MEIEFHGQYDKRSFIKAYLLARKPSRRETLLRLGLSFICIVILAAYFIYQVNHDHFSTFELLRQVLYLVGVGFFLFDPYVYAYIMALIHWKNPAFQKPFAGAVSAQGIAFFTSANRRRDIYWDAYVKKRITEDMLVLISATNELTFFIPRFFNSAEDWKRVIQLANYKVVNAA